MYSLECLGLNPGWEKYCSCVKKASALAIAEKALPGSRKNRSCVLKQAELTMPRIVPVFVIILKENDIEIQNFS